MVPLPWYGVHQLIATYAKMDTRLLDRLMDTFWETVAALPGLVWCSKGPVSYSCGPNMRARRTQLCSVRGRIDAIPARGLRPLPTCPRQSSSLPAAPTDTKHVRVVVTRP